MSEAQTTEKAMKREAEMSDFSELDVPDFRTWGGRSQR